MVSFTKFITSFVTMRFENDLNTNFSNSRGYFWRIGEPAKLLFQSHFEQSNQYLKICDFSTFKSMFEEGEELLGIPISKSLGNYNGIKLYKMNERKQDFLINNFLSNYNGFLLNKDFEINVISPDTNEIINKLLNIKPETLIMNGGFEGVDKISSRTSGTINNSDYKKEMIMGTIDYKTGNLSLLRSNCNNDGVISQEKQIAIDINCSYIVFDNPVTVVWEFKM